MITRSLAQQMAFTSFLIQRDALSVCFSRMGSGFSPPTVLADAKVHLENIQKLLEGMEKMAAKPKEEIVAKDYQHFQRSCCGRGD